MIKCLGIKIEKFFEEKQSFEENVQDMIKISVKKTMIENIWWYIFLEQIMKSLIFLHFNR